MAASSLIPPAVSTAYLVSELRAARGWQRDAIAEATETAVEQIARWTAVDLDNLEPHDRRQVEAILSVDSTLPWWTRVHA